MAENARNSPVARAFFNRVFDFVNTYGNEFTEDHAVEFDWSDPENPSARLAMLFGGGLWYRVPIIRGTDGNAAIDIGDAGTLKLNGHGLFAYLFQEAHHARVRDAAETVGA